MYILDEADFRIPEYDDGYTKESFERQDEDPYDNYQLEEI